VIQSAALLLALVAAGPSPSPSPAATAQPSPAAPASVAPAGAPPAAATTSPGPAPVATATPTPYAYRFVPRQPDHIEPGTPQIFAVYLNSKQLRSLGPILIKVVTSPDVTKVISRNGGQEGSIPMIAPGDFEANGKLPKVPFIAAGITIDLEFVATSSTGQKVTVRVPVRID
jgi:hypothetical protein